MSEVPIANMAFCPTVTRPRSSQGTARWTGFASRASTRRRCSVGFSTRKPATGASARSRARGGCAARPVPVGGKVKPWELDAAGKAILGAVARRGGELLERARPRHLGGARQATTRSSSRGTTPSRPRRSIGSTCGRAGPARAPRGRKGRATTGSSSTAVRTRRRSVLPRPAPRCLLDRRASRLLARGRVSTCCVPLSRLGPASVAALEPELPVVVYCWDGSVRLGRVRLLACRGVRLRLLAFAHYFAGVRFDRARRLGGARFDRCRRRRPSR